MSVLSSWKSRLFSRSLALICVIGLALPLAWHGAASAQSTNAKLDAAPTDGTLSSYRLGRGDMLSVQVFGEEDMSVEKIRLTDAGTFLHPVLGELRVLGLTVGDLERMVADGLRGRYLVNPKVSVRLDEYRPFFINGVVFKPGAYPYQPGLTVHKAASLGGGFKETADLANISVIREFDPKSATHAALDTPVFPGDTVEVAEFKQFFVNGMVYKPGGYPYQLGMTVQKAVSVAGGFRERASQNKIFVIRHGSENSNSEKVDLTTPIYQGDIITVEESFF